VIGGLSNYSAGSCYGASPDPRSLPNKPTSNAYLGACQRRRDGTIFARLSIPSALRGRLGRRWGRHPGGGYRGGMERILVSACLLGQPVRYDGRSKRRDDQILRQWQAEGRLVSCCPEIAGGLPVPRPPAEITVRGDAPEVRTQDGADVTGFFTRGAEDTLAVARRHGVRMAVLKEGSPSCGSSRIYDGTFSGRSVLGAGVTTALLERHGIRVFSENELDKAAAYLRDMES
jgi:uncharacterized protein YbbK (DUF523 family)